MIMAIIVMMRIKRIIIIVSVAVGITQPLFFGGMFGFLTEQRLAILLGDLIIVRMDFAKCQKTMAIAAIINERRLKRRFYPCNLGKINIALELLVFSRFEIKFFDPVSLDDGHAGFFPVAGVDQHPHCHLIISERARPPSLAEQARE